MKREMDATTISRFFIYGLSLSFYDQRHPILHLAFHHQVETVFFSGFHHFIRLFHQDAGEDQHAIGRNKVTQTILKEADDDWSKDVGKDQRGRGESELTRADFFH